MVKYGCDKCDDTIDINEPRYIIRIQDANHKGKSDRLVCLCETCKEVMEEHVPWLFQIGYSKKEVIR